MWNQKQLNRLRSPKIYYDYVKKTSEYPCAYEEIPFSPHVHTRNTHSPLKNISSLQHKNKVMFLAKKKINTHFQQIHNNYRQKQNVKLKNFTIKSKTQHRQNKYGVSSFIEQHFSIRQQKIKQLNKCYLNDISQKLFEKQDQYEQHEDNIPWQHKVIHQFNIIYDYRTQKIKINLS